MSTDVFFTKPIWVILFCFMSACGGGGGGSDTNDTSSGTDEPINSVATAEGVFIDSPVQGLRFVSGSTEGVTDVNGTFTYEVGTNITFSVGDIVIGSATGAAILSPLSLVAEALDETDPTVVNIAAFLQTLDDDGDSENGITITEAQQTEASGLTINFTQSTFDFEFDADVQNVVSILTSITIAGGRALISADVALAHLQMSLGIEVVTDETGSGNEDFNFGTIMVSGVDADTFGTSLVVESGVYGREDLTNLETSVILTGRGIIINNRADEEQFTVADIDEGFVIVVGDTTLMHAISMKIIHSSGEYSYICEACSVNIDDGNQTVFFDEAIVTNVDTQESLTLNGTINWMFEE